MPCTLNKPVPPRLCESKDRHPNAPLPFLPCSWKHPLSCYLHSQNSHDEDDDDDDSDEEGAKMNDPGRQGNNWNSRVYCPPASSQVGLTVMCTQGHQVNSSRIEFIEPLIGNPIFRKCFCHRRNYPAWGDASSHLAFILRPQATHCLPPRRWVLECRACSINITKQ